MFVFLNLGSAWEFEGSGQYLTVPSTVLFWRDSSVFFSWDLLEPLLKQRGHSPECYHHHWEHFGLHFPRPLQVSLSAPGTSPVSKKKKNYTYIYIYIYTKVYSGLIYYWNETAEANLPQIEVKPAPLRV